MIGEVSDVILALALAGFLFSASVLLMAAGTFVVLELRDRWKERKR